MKDLQFLKDLNQHLYDNPNTDFKGWKLIQSYSDKTGVFINLYQSKQEYILAIRGTDVDPTKVNINDILQDTANDLAIYTGQLPEQYKQVKEFYLKNEKTNITLTGYSLGGSLAQILGNEFGLETITFEALGTKHIMGNKHPEKISNYINVLDMFVHPTIPNQIGKVYVMAVTPKQELYPYEPLNFYYHWYPQYGNVNKTEIYDRKKEKSKPISKYVKDGIINKSKPITTKLQQQAKDLLNTYK